MKGKMLGFILIGFLLVVFNAFAADGNVIVNGKVGIGINNTPGFKLEVNESSSGSGWIGRFQKNIGSGEYAGILLGGGPNHEGIIGYMDNITAASRYWALGIGGDNIFSGTGVFIYQGGRLGVATAPGDYKLSVLGPVWSEEGYWHTSDAALKKDVTPISNAMDKILQMDGVSFNWVDRGKGFPMGKDYGVIAQQIEVVLPEAVKDGPDGAKAVAYSKIIPVLIEAIKEQQKEIETLKTKVGLNK